MNKIIQRQFPAGSRAYLLLLHVRQNFRPLGLNVWIKFSTAKPAMANHHMIMNFGVLKSNLAFSIFNVFVSWSIDLSYHIVNRRSEQYVMVECLHRYSIVLKFITGRIWRLFQPNPMLENLMFCKLEEKWFASRNTHVCRWAKIYHPCTSIAGKVTSNDS